MRRLVIGIDSGTQSTKSLVVDTRSGAVLGTASEGYGLIEGLPAGYKEQDPGVWVSAMIRSVVKALKAAKAARGEVIGIGVSGQQHGFVPLDKKGGVIRPAKLWCDTSTIEECEILTDKLGGVSKAIRTTGNAFLPGFTAPKVLWLKRHEPKNFKLLSKVLLPHDYLNYWLTGEMAMEFGDASGTALFDVRKRQYSQEVLRAIDEKLEGCMPRLILSDQAVGRLNLEAAEAMGLEPGIMVSAGGGDNMMGAIGTGNTRPGVVTASFGTSGTIYACSDKPIIDPKGEIAAFCDSTNQWLPLLCTMNVTVATEMVRKRFGLTHQQFEKAAQRVSAGSSGLMLIPYFEGERTPNIPDGTGVFLGVRPSTFDVGHMARATMEGVTLGMNYGLNRMRQLKLDPSQIRATGGGANSRAWLQMMADIFNVEVVTLKVGEGAAYGAALQALWCWQGQQGEKTSISQITDKFVKLDNRQRFEPRAEMAEVYRELQELHDQTSLALRTSFTKHHQLMIQKL